MQPIWVIGYCCAQHHLSACLSIHKSICLSVQWCCSCYPSIAHNIQQILFIFDTAMTQHESYWLWGIYVHFLWFCGTFMKFYEYTDWLVFGPAVVTTVQPTICNEFCSHLRQPFTLVGAWTLSIMGTLCQFSSILWHFEILWIHWLVFAACFCYHCTAHYM